MNTRLVLIVSALAVAVPSIDAQTADDSSGSLAAFRSDAELTVYFRRLAQERERWVESQRQVAQARRNCGSIRVARRGGQLSPTDRAAAVIDGKVVNEDGTPVEGATVAIETLGLSALTLDDGVFTLRPSRDSLTKRREWPVTVRRLGYGTRQTSIQVGPGDSVALAVTICVWGPEMEELRLTSSVSGGRSAREDITNTQHAGVDEGGIVKVHGEHLVILRRGRLFTVRIGNDLRPVSMVNAFGPGINPRGAWYDEMLISGDKVVVIGYSYAGRGTEIGVFRITSDGDLRYLSTYHLRSNDYYSSRNYASRLLGTKLVFYAPHYLWTRSGNPLEMLPAMRRWRPGKKGEFTRILAPTRIYRPAIHPRPSDLALHTVTTCDLATAELECEATAVVGPAGRVFYVSPSAVYVWLSQWYEREQSDSSNVLYRMPLDGSTPTAARVSGSPVDQFSFLESTDGHLNVLVRADAHGDAMWRAERTTGRIALARIPLDRFGNGSREVAREHYRELPSPDGPILVNRFVGDHLLYGTGNSWGRPRTRESVLHVVPWNGGDVTSLALAHGADRIESMGTDAVVIGTDGRDLHFSGISLAQHPRVALRYSMSDAAQGELRSHGFFYRRDGATTGILGLPVRAGGSAGYEHLRTPSASILFLRNDSHRFAELGKLEADDASPRNDGCVASCVDWYGNARPVFLRGRVFALLGYELVEGRIEPGGIREIGRVSFSPRFIRAVNR